MSRNPLFTEGFYFFSNMYDDTLLSDFYPKVISEIWSASMNSQKTMATRGLRSSGDFNFYRGSINDFVVNETFNTRCGFNRGTWSMKLPGFVLPVWNEKKYYRTYLSGNSQFIKVPQQDTFDKQNIFDHAVTIQFGEFYFMTATFVVSMNHMVYLVLPYNKDATVKEDGFWNSDDYLALTSYINGHGEDETDDDTALWIVPVDHEIVVKISPTTGKKAAIPFQQADLVNVMGQTRYHLSINTGNYNYSFIGDKRLWIEAASTRANQWELLIYNRNRGNDYWLIPVSLENSYTNDSGVFGGDLYFSSNSFIKDKIGVNGKVEDSGYYCYLINRENRRKVLRRPVSNIVNLYMPADSNDARKEIVPSAFNIDIYRYDITKQNRTCRLGSYNVDVKYYPAIYDLYDFGIDDLDIEVDIRAYLPSETKQEFHNSINKIFTSLGTDGYKNFVINGADIVEEGDPSFLQDYAPTAQYVSTEDYAASDYVSDFRGYYLDKILKTIQTDPMLNEEYLKFAENIDPLVVTVVGTPKTIGFNTNNKTVKDSEFIGSNPVVMNTKDYRRNSLEEIIYFDEPHSFISVYSNGEFVDVEVYIRGIHMIPTCQTFKDGVNYIFLPCAAVATEILKFANVKAQLATSRPIVLDIYPHSYPREIGPLKFSRTVRTGRLYSLDFGENVHKTIRPLDLYFYPTGSKNLQKNFFDYFDIELTVNRFALEIDTTGPVLIDTESLLPFDSENPSGVTISDGTHTVFFEFCLRKDQSLDSFLPVIYGIWPGASVKPAGEKVISLRDTIDDLVSNRVIDEREAYRLMCRSLPLDQIKLRLIDENYDGTSVTIGLRNFGKSIEFSGGVLVDDEFEEPFYTEEPDESLIEYELNSVYYQDDNLGAFEVDVYDFLIDPINEIGDGANPWLLFRNGRCDPSSIFTLTSNQVGSMVHITSNLLGSTEYPGADAFEIVHVPYPLTYNLLRTSKSLRYMGSGRSTGDVIQDVWGDLDISTYNPLQKGLLLVDTIDNDDSMRLGGPGAMIFNNIGCRLTIPLSDTNTEVAAFYIGNSDLAINTDSIDPCFTMKHYTGLAITKEMNITHQSITKLIMDPSKKEILQMRIFGNPELDPDERFRSLILQDDGFKVYGNMTWPSRVQRLNINPSWTETGIEDLKFNILAYIKPNRMLTINSETTYVSLDGGLTWDEAAGMEFPYSANWSALAYGKYDITGDEMVVLVNSENQNFLFSRELYHGWNERTITHDSAYEETGWSQIAYGNGIFVALSDDHNFAARIEIGLVELSEEGMWVFSEIEQCPVEPWGGLVFTGKGFLAVNKAGTRGYFSADGISWSSFDPRYDQNKLDYLHGLANESHIGVFSGGIGAPPIRRARKTSGGGWSVVFPENEKMNEFIVDSDGYIDTSYRDYPNPYLSGDEESILVTYLREYRIAEN